MGANVYTLKCVDHETGVVIGVVLPYHVEISCSHVLPDPLQAGSVSRVSPYIVDSTEVFDMLTQNHVKLIKKDNYFRVFVLSTTRIHFENCRKWKRRY